MNKTVVIGFGHKARRGKDTAVSAIIEKYGQQFDIRRYAFADALKTEVNEAAKSANGMLGLFTLLPAIAKQQTGKPLPEWVTYDKDAPMDDPLCPLGKQRALLQWWGTEFRRDRDPYYWVKKLRSRIEAEQPQFALISDLRFMNEAIFIASMYGVSVRVERTGYSSIVTEAHQSEHELDNFNYDCVIEAGDGDLEEVKKCANYVFEEVLARVQGTTVFTPEEKEVWHVATPEGTETVAAEQARLVITG